MTHQLKRTAARIIAYVLLLGGALPALALGSAKMRLVRVGFYHAEGYHVMDEAGNRSGYGYDVLQAMKLYNNWEYEYVGYDKGWSDMQQMLLDGEIDMVVSAVKTPARAEIYDFSERVIAQSGACLMVRAGESPYVAGQYEDYDGIRIGFIEGASHIASTEAFAAEKGFTYQPVYYKTSDELEKAIQTGTDIDAAVTSNMRIVANTRRLDMFAMQDVHVMVQKGNRELLKEVDFALEQISLYRPGFYESTFNKYYSVDMGDNVFFSPDESAFIAECQASGEVLRASLVPDLSPYAFFEDGAPSGILYDIASEILRRTGLCYELIETNSDAEYRALIDHKGVDVRFAARYDANYAESLGYNLASPYYTTDVSRVTRKDNSGNIGERIAVVKNSMIDVHYLPTIIKDETVIRLDTAEACISALLNGSCDAVYLLTRSAQEAVYNDETNRLTSVIMPHFAVSFSIGVREDADARLASILEKASVSVSENDIAALVLRYTDYTAPPLSLLGLLYNNPIIVVTIVTLLLAILFAALLLLFFTRQRKQEREQNRQLQEALDSAERANSAKSVFMSRMSHEIRTPLNAIVGYNSISASTLSAAKSETEFRQAAMKAMDCLTKSDIASKHLLTVINDVLDMSAIESGKIKIARDPFDFRNMISALTVMFFSQAKAKDIDFEVLFDSPVEEWFRGDQMRIDQILTNLLSNAIKFTPAGGCVYLTIQQETQSEQDARITFTIRDTGIGMHPDFMKNIWQPFEQADASISRRYGGTGLGLSITKNLVDLMGGEICVQSEEGVGSTFTVRMPLTRMEQPEKAGAYDFSGVHALVVDDDRSTCDYLKLLFSRYDVRCASATSGKEAIALVAERIARGDPYTVCIVDWQMPEIDGLATVKAIREIAGFDIPIIVISAYDFSEIEQAAKDVGVNSFIAKPLFQSAIFELLASISGKRETVVDDVAIEHDFGGAHVLLAEDNRMNMEIAKAILAQWNITVEQAWNGREAVAMFCSAPAGTYKLVLMDVHMPELDGYRATQMIRASSHAEAGAIPIYAMTADVFAEDVAEALAAGMNGHIGKPIDHAVLLDTLLKHIDA